MNIHEIAIKNFRLLKDIRLALHEKTTLIVGRNNSGKTSLTELFSRLFAHDHPTFRLEDFHCGDHPRFWSAYLLYNVGKLDSEVRHMLPVIEAQITVKYGTDDTDLGPLSDFVIDVDLACTTAIVDIRYEVADGKIGQLFADIDFFDNDTEEQKKCQFYRIIKERLPKYFNATVRAIDPSNALNTKQVGWGTVSAATW